MTGFIEAMTAAGGGVSPFDGARTGNSGEAEHAGHGAGRPMAKLGLALANQGKRPLQTCFVGVPPDLTAEYAAYKRRS